MPEETPTIEGVKADLRAHLVTAKAKVAPLATAVKTAEKAMGDVAVAHAKNPNLAALVEASGILTKANDELAGAASGVTRLESKLADVDKQAQREADRETVVGLVKKGRDKCPEMHTIHTGLSVSGTIPVADLNPTKDELAVCERHDIHVVTVATVREEGKPPLLSVTFFGKAKRASSGRGGGGGRAKTYTDGTLTGNAQVMAEKYKPESAAKIAAALADGKSASYSHIATGLVEAGTITEA